MCSKSNGEPPLDIINLISHRRYNFSLREKFITKQITDAIENYADHKNYIGFYGEAHVYEILRNLCEHYSNVKSDLKIKTQATEEELFKGFLRSEDLKTTHTTGGEKAKQENTNKFAMMMALFQFNSNK